VHGIEEKKLNEILEKIKKTSIAKYSSTADCLLIVNRFETFETDDKLEVPKIDSTKLENECEVDLLPIPNFIDYHYLNKKNDLKLDEDFEIYVLESDRGNHFETFKLGQAPQMSTKWKNGYSKGIAVNEKKKTVIFWSIIW
jgi:hypothetical protein